MDFKNKFDRQRITSSEKPQARNLKYISVENYTDKIIIKADPKTRIKSNLIRSKLSQNEKRESKLLSIKTTSIFLGITSIKDNFYLILGDQIRTFKFGNIEIYELNSVVLYEFQSFEKNEDLSEIFTLYYKQGFFFSYDIDLTYSQNYKLAFQDKIDYKKMLRLNFFFFANRFLLEKYFDNLDWLVPIIHGKVNCNVFINNNNKLIKVYFIYKRSIFSVNKGYQKDVELFQDFFCPDEFETIDVFREFGGKVNSFGLVTNDFFGNFNIFLEYKLGNDFNFGINPQKVKKHLEFMKFILGIDLFVFQGDNQIVQLLEEFLADQKSLKGKIKIFKKNGFEKILHVINKIAEENVENDSNYSKINLNICSSKILYIYEEVLLEMTEKILIKQQKTQKKIKKRNSLFNNPAKEESKKEIELMRYFLKQISDIKKKTMNFEETLKNMKKNYKITIKLNLTSSLFGHEKGTSLAIRKLIEKNKIDIFTHKNIIMTFITHNCGGLPKDQDLKNLIKYGNIEDIKNSSLVIIGLQEIVEMKGKNFGKIITNDNEEVLDKWIGAIGECFEEFNLVGYSSMLGLVLIVLQNVKTVDELEVRPFKKKLIKQGFMSFANKGGIFLGLKVNYENFGVFNCHLASGTKKTSFKKRKENLSELEDYLNYKQNLSMKFIMGDFNFRNQLDINDFHLFYSDYKSQKKTYIKNEILDKIKEGDEFQEVKQETNLINGYIENPIEFLPSYKWQKNDDVYDFKEGKRIPSWTDRIIYKCDNFSNFASIIYDSDMKTRFSDHKPVYLIGKSLVRNLKIREFIYAFKHS